MPDYWVFPITEDNLNICLKRQVIGASGNNEKRVGQIQPGDYILFYVSRRFYNRARPKVREFRALVKCTDRSFKDSKNLWPTAFEGSFPTRLPIRVISQKECKIEPLIAKLSFIKNKENWGLSFLSGVRRIPPHDFNLILENMK